MSSDPVDRTVKGIGHGVTVHNALEWALEETAKKAGETNADCPNIWNYTMLAMVYADYMKNPLSPDEAMEKFINRMEELDQTYGTEKLHKMSREERWEREYAAALFFTYLGAHQLQKEEQQWSDDELVATKREESNAR